MNSIPVDILHLPVEQLAAFSLRRLKDERTFKRASKSTLYCEKWKKAGIKAEEIETYEDLARIPFTTSRELRKAINEDPIEDVLCSDPVHWLSTTGTTGTPKWIPYGQRDIELFIEIKTRCNSFLPTGKGRKRLAVCSPAPLVENSLPIFNMIGEMRIHSQTEGLVFCFTEVEQEDAVNFALDIKPSLIAAFPGLAARFAEIIQERAPEVARQKFNKHKSFRNLVVYLVTRVKKISPKDLSKFELGFFGGEPLDPYREFLKRSFGLEPYELYCFTEFMHPTMECSMHDGMHLWMDICIPEIIPESELEKEKEDSTYVPKALPLWKTERGLRGEYVLTTFGEVLPLIRYRVGDLIEVVGTEPCRCGITHPRIKVLRRSDTTICLGAIRFPAEQLEEKLLAKTTHGQAKRWQLEITRQGYHPKPIIRVEPYGKILNEESFLKEISNRLLEIEFLKTGIESKIVSDPTVILQEKISEEGRPVAKAGRIIYEDK